MAIPALPQQTDNFIRQLWLSNFIPPVLTASLELGLIELLDREPLSVQALSERLQLSTEAVEALTSVLGGLELLSVDEEGRFRLTDISYHYLRRESPFYWGDMLRLFQEVRPCHDSLMKTLRQHKPATLDDGAPLTGGWENFSLTPQRAREITSAMQSLSMAPAYGLARKLRLPEGCRMLDIGGGSGCYSIALAQHNPQARFTIADLQPVCDIARNNIQAAGQEQRVDTLPLDMFNQPWPNDYNTIFAANIFHDWDAEQRRFLLNCAHRVLPPGGEIMLYEMLIDENQAGPLVAGLFSVNMLYVTKGKQFRASELKEMLEQSGFQQFEANEIYAGYSLIRARAV